MCFVTPANSWSRTRPFLRAGRNLTVTNCLSQQLVPCMCACVSCVRCCRRAAVSHLFRPHCSGRAAWHRPAAYSPPRGNVHREQWEVRPPLRSQQNRFAFEFKLRGVHGVLTNAASVSSPVTWVMAISLCSFPSSGYKEAFYFKLTFKSLKGIQ